MIWMGLEKSLEIWGFCLLKLKKIVPGELCQLLMSGIHICYYEWLICISFSVLICVPIGSGYCQKIPYQDDTET